MASLNDSVASVSTSAPRRGRVCCVVRPPPNTPPNRSPTRPREPAPVSVPPNRSLRSNGKPPAPPAPPAPGDRKPPPKSEDRKSTRLNSSHLVISYAVFCLKKKKYNNTPLPSSKKKQQNL